MSAPGAVVPFLIFEAAGCLMAVPASEVRHLEKRGRVEFTAEWGRVEFSRASLENSTRPHSFDLGAYFEGHESNGPWLEWTRGPRRAWLRVRRVVDVVPVALAALTPMPARLRAQEPTRAFLAAGVRDNEVFLLLDPARLAA